MINLKGCIELGIISRTHGIKGNLILKLKDYHFNDIIRMEQAYIIIDGLPVPFFVEEYSERNPGTILIKFEDINSETDARNYTDLTVYVSNKVFNTEVQDRSDTFKLSGYRVVDKVHGELGILDALLAYDRNPVLRVLDNNKEILIPYQEEFIIDIIDSSKKIFVECPEGLLDLYK